MRTPLSCLMLSCAAMAAGQDIAIQPLGKVPEARIGVVKAALENAFVKNVAVLPSKPLPKEAWYEPRSRYRAEKLLEFLTGVAGEVMVIGITGKDISTTKGEAKDWGVFGLGELGGPACVVSTFRLNARGGDEAKLRERLGKVAVHELGHVIGLDHCTAPRCVMRDAQGSMTTVDEENGGFCAACRKEISEANLQH